MDMKVFWSVLAALGFAAVVILMYDRIQEYRAAAAFQGAMEQIAQIPAQAQREAAVASEQQQRRQAALQIQDMMARTLAADEQCIGGTVIRVNGSTYVQVSGADGRPEACAGRIRAAAR